MNLFNSILTTCIIVAAVWFIALSQSSFAFAAADQEQKITTTTTVKKSSPVAPQAETIKKAEVLHIAGITQKIHLVDIQKLWQKFTDRSTLHKQLKQKPQQVYVLYKALADNYQVADVTIGYNINELRKFNDHISVNTAHYENLLPPKPYTEQEISKAWKKINFRQKVDYILEVHNLNNKGDVTTTELFVSYKA